jgi:hypothetical protein
MSGPGRNIALLALLGSVAVAGCATVPPEQAERDARLLAAARECEATVSIYYEKATVGWHFEKLDEAVVSRRYRVD